jgi:hypothetical protein
MGERLSRQLRNDMGAPMAAVAQILQNESSLPSTIATAMFPGIAADIPPPEG